MAESDCICHLIRLPSRRTGTPPMHAEDCPAVSPAPFDRRAFILGTTGLDSDEECSEHARLVGQVTAMADILDSLSLTLMGAQVGDWRELLPVARRLATNARLRDAMHTLADNQG